MRQSIIPVFVPHLGCPNDCRFCNQHRITGTKAAQPQDVRAALEGAPEGAEIAFYGGSFTAIASEEQEALLAAAQPFFPKLSGIRVSTRPDCIDEEILARLIRFGVKTVELGAQSMDDGVLAAANRGHSAQQVRESAALIKQSGMKLGLQMMTGLPEDSLEKSLYTAHEFVLLSPDMVRIYPTVIIRDTALYDDYIAGTYREHTVEEAVEYCAKIVPVFEEAGIPVIRLGLNPTDDLSDGDAAAGAYHPALGELVYSRIYLERAVKLLEGYRGKRPVLAVDKKHVSIMVGQKRCNIRALCERFGFESVKVKVQDSLCDEIIIEE